MDEECSCHPDHLISLGSLVFLAVSSDVFGDVFIVSLHLNLGIRFGTPYLNGAVHYESYSAAATNA